MGSLLNHNKQLGRSAENWIRQTIQNNYQSLLGTEELKPISLRYRRSAGNWTRQTIQNNYQSLLGTEELKPISLRYRRSAGNWIRQTIQNDCLAAAAVASCGPSAMCAYIFQWLSLC